MTRSQRWFVLSAVVFGVAGGNAPAQESASTSVKERPKVESLAIQPEPYKLEPGKPISLRALTSHPQPIPDALSWTVETRRHRGQLMCMALSPDQTQLAAGGIDGTIRVWNLATGALVRAMVGHDYYVSSMSWSPDGSTLASVGAYDGLVRLWSARNGMLLRVFRAPKQHSSRIAWSPDGTRLVGVGGASGWVWIWDARSDKSDIILELGQAIYSVAWSPTSTQIVLTAVQSPISIYDCAVGKTTLTIGDPQVTRYNAAWSPDGTRMASGEAALTTIYEMPEGKQLQTFPTMGYGMAWAPDSKRLATASSGGVTQVWELASGRSLKTFTTVGLDLLWPADDQLISRSTTNLAVWNPNEGLVIKDYNVAGTTPPAWNANRPIISGMGTDKLTLWDNLTAKQLKTLEGHKATVNAVAWTRDGKTLASASSDKSVALWETGSGKLSKSLTDHTGAVSCLVWSPDGKTLASGGADNVVRLWHVTGKSLGKLEGHKKAITDLAWSQRGNLLASASYDGSVRLWNAERQNLIHDVAAGRPLSTVAFNPDGSMFACGAPNDNSRLYTSSGKPTGKTATVTSGYPAATTMAWSSDGSAILTGHSGHAAQLWTWQDAKVIHTLYTWASVRYVAWTPALIMVTGCYDRTVRFWDPQTAELRGMILEQEDHIVIMSPDGHYRIDKSHEPDFVYVVQTPTEQLNMKPAEFSTKYRWKNVPANVKFTGKL